MTDDEKKIEEGHRKRHEELHAALDELAADWAAHQPFGKVFSNSTIMELLQWSAQQAIGPDDEISVNEMVISLRTYNCLKNANIQTIGQLITHTKWQLLRIKKCGEKALSEIEKDLAQRGLQLRQGRRWD